MPEEIGYRPPRKPYWTRGAKTRLHTYYYPADGLPGVLLLGLIAVLGAVAVGVALRHVLIRHAIERRDGILLAIGIFLFVLGGVQAVRLWRDR